jgi:hypothetical protein
MSVAARISRPFRYLGAMAALAALITGCASTPPPTASAAGSPATAAELRDLGDFTKKAQDEGWAPQVRGGRVLYCIDETPVVPPSGKNLSRSGQPRAEDAGRAAAARIHATPRRVRIVRGPALHVVAKHYGSK